MSSPDSEARSVSDPVVNGSGFHIPSFLLGALLIGLLAGLFVLLTRAPQPPPIALHPPPTPAPLPTPLPTATPAPIVVYVSGAVNQPGLYSIPADGRVGDALAMAGGFAPHAEGDLLNLAERLWDGARVHVAYRQIETVAGDQNVQAESESELVVTATTGEGAQPASGISGGQLPTPTPSPNQSATGSTPTGSTEAGPTGGRINLNTATQRELESLPGIGPARAQAIIDNRPYSRVDELTRVSGIGTGILAQVRDLVTVD